MNDIFSVLMVVVVAMIVVAYGCLAVRVKLNGPKILGQVGAVLYLCSFPVAVAALVAACL